MVSSRESCVLLCRNGTAAERRRMLAHVVRHGFDGELHGIAAPERGDTRAVVSSPSVRIVPTAYAVGKHAPPLRG